MPLTWHKVTARLDPVRFTMKSALRVIEKNGDPLIGVLDRGIDVEELLGALVRSLEATEA